MIYVNFLTNIPYINRNTHPTHNKQEIFEVAKQNDYVVYLQADLSVLVSSIMPNTSTFKQLLFYAGCGSSSMAECLWSPTFLCVCDYDI